MTRGRILLDLFLLVEWRIEWMWVEAERSLVLLAAISLMGTGKLLAALG